MHIQKLKKEHYRVREMYQGKIYSKYYPYKPTQREAQKDINELIDKDYYSEDVKFSKCAEIYINSKINILSPSTIRRYKMFAKSIEPRFMDLSINQIDKIKLQTLVNEYVLTHKPKTTKSFYGFISSVIKFYTDKQFKVILPLIPKSTAYIPTKYDIQQILNVSKQTRYEIPILLASYGLRIGEIMALTIDDIKNGKITINKTIVYDENYKKILKTPKTVESNRIIKVPLYITDLIKQKKEIYKGSASALNRFLFKVQDTLNIKHFTIHKLRHFFATELHNRNVPSKYIQAMGGWATDNIMKSVYTHTTKELETIDIFESE